MDANACYRELIYVRVYVQKTDVLQKKRDSICARVCVQKIYFL